MKKIQDSTPYFLYNPTSKYRVVDIATEQEVCSPSKEFEFEFADQENGIVSFCSKKKVPNWITVYDEQMDCYKKVKIYVAEKEIVEHRAVRFDKKRRF